MMAVLPVCATLSIITGFYNQFFGLGLHTHDLDDIVEYLKSLSDSAKVLASMRLDADGSRVEE